MKFSPKCRTKKLGMINTILRSFYSFFNWKGVDNGAKSGLGNPCKFVILSSQQDTSNEYWQYKSIDNERKGNFETLGIGVGDTDIIPLDKTPPAHFCIRGQNLPMNFTTRT